jgi:hypothetical protein
MECFIVIDLFEKGSYSVAGVFMKRKNAEEWMSNLVNYNCGKYGNNRYIIEDCDIDDYDEQ